MCGPTEVTFRAPRRGPARHAVHVSDAAGRAAGTASSNPKRMPERPRKKRSVHPVDAARLPMSGEDQISYSEYNRLVSRHLRSSRLRDSAHESEHYTSAPQVLLKSRNAMRRSVCAQSKGSQMSDLDADTRSREALKYELTHFEKNVGRESIDKVADKCGAPADASIILKLIIIGMAFTYAKVQRGGRRGRPKGSQRNSMEMGDKLIQKLAKEYFLEVTRCILLLGVDKITLAECDEKILNIKREKVNSHLRSVL